MWRVLESGGRSGGRLRVAGRWSYPDWPTANIEIILATRRAMDAARALIGVAIAFVLADRLGRKPFLVVSPLFVGAGAAAAAFTWLMSGSALGAVLGAALIRVAQAALVIALAWAPTRVAASAIYVARLLVSRVGLPLRTSYVRA